MKKAITVIASALLAAGLLPALVTGQLVFAQDRQDQESAQSNNEDAAAQEDNEKESNQENADDEQQADSSQEDGSGGFVPSEDISEDLSVSFPVDI